jgi:hypothetical protein
VAALGILLLIPVTQVFNTHHCLALKASPAQEEVRLLITDGIVGLFDKSV